MIARRMIAMAGGLACAAGLAAGGEDDLLKAQPGAVEAWKDMRFGMFICWGPVTLTGREIGWSRGNPTPIAEYDELYKKWNPDRFDAREWAGIVKDTGCKYVVFLTKHHDGFCLWDTKQTDHSIMNGPFKRDVTRELAAACREQGIGFFPYYSTCDWYHPDFPLTSPGGKVERPASNLDQYTGYLEAQVRELITGCGPLTGIWFDVPQRFDRARGERVIRFARSLQPDLLVNNRTGAPGDFDTPEQTVGRCQFDRPWESCITLGTQWSWKPDDTLKPWTDAVRILVACAVGDGNLALNTNPMPDGRIEPRQVESFRRIGAWLQRYGESVYGTRGGPFVAPGGGAVRARGDRFGLPAGPWWGGSTHKGNAVYLHILRWPADRITLPPIGRRIVKHGVLTGGEATVKQTDAGIEVGVPAAQRDDVDTIVKLELDGPARDIAPMVPAAPGGGGSKASASSVWGAGYEADQACDGDESTRWGAAPESRSGWLAIDLGAAKAVDRAVVMEIGFPRTEKFTIEAGDGEAWRPLVSGAATAGRRLYSFAPVTGRVFRLNIAQAGDVPTIEEFRLLAPGEPPPPSMIEEERKQARLAWFHEAKYGLFINWGLYAIPAGEWKGKAYAGIGEWIMHQAKVPVKEYEQLATRFNPAGFDADAWAQLAVDAGMKYVVYDCKHHDGFAMYRSKVSAYNVHDATPWKRDPFKELQQACAKRGLRFCFYYSQATDWHEPDGANNTWDFAPNDRKDFDRYLREKSLPQVRELLENYGPIGLIWFDVPTLMTPERSRRFVDLVRSIQPDTLINSRLGPGGLHDYQSRGDNEIPPVTTPGAWETAATLNDTWGFKKDDHNWKSPADICFKLVDIVSKGGNYLLNVGPDAEGRIPQPSQDVLRRVGAWLKVNGEAVYGAGRTPFGDELGAFEAGKTDAKGRPVFHARTDWRCTTKPGFLYVHLFRWPGASFALDGVKGRVVSARFLSDASGSAVPFRTEGGRTTFTLPARAPDDPASVLRITVEAP